MAASKKVFTALARDTKARLEKFKKVIAYFKDLESWGPDTEGNVFTFEVFQHSSLPGAPIMILGSYAKPRKKTAWGLLIGLPSNVEGCDYDTYDGWYPNQGTPIEKATNVRRNCGRMYSYVNQDADQIVRAAVLDFVRVHMRNHPRYQEAIQSTTDKVVKTIKARPPIPRPKR